MVKDDDDDDDGKCKYNKLQISITVKASSTCNLKLKIASAGAKATLKVNKIIAKFLIAGNCRIDTTCLHVSNNVSVGSLCFDDVSSFLNIHINIVVIINTYPQNLSLIHI